MKEMFPLFNKIWIFNKESSLKNISSNLTNVSRKLKENDLNIKNFYGFTQNLTILFPQESKSVNTVADLFSNEKLNEEQREKKFYEIIEKEKNLLFNVIEPWIRLNKDKIGIKDEQTEFMNEESQNDNINDGNEEKEKVLIENQKENKVCA